MKEKKKETFLNWLHDSLSAPWVLFFGQYICSIIYMGCYYDLDIINGTTTGEFTSTSGETLRIVNAIAMSLGKLVYLLGTIM
jgi:hypothetical protein